MLNGFPTYCYKATDLLGVNLIKEEKAPTPQKKNNPDSKVNIAIYSWQKKRSWKVLILDFASPKMPLCWLKKAWDIPKKMNLPGLEIKIESALNCIFSPWFSLAHLREKPESWAMYFPQSVPGDTMYRWHAMHKRTTYLGQMCTNWQQGWTALTLKKIYKAP